MWKQVPIKNDIDLKSSNSYPIHSAQSNASYISFIAVLKSWLRFQINISVEKSEYYTQTYKPNITSTKEKFTAGRSSIERKQASTIDTLQRFSSHPLIHV